MELAALVTLRAAQAVNAFGFARAELAEVLGRPGHHVLEELKRDAAQRFAWRWCKQQQWNSDVWCRRLGKNTSKCDVEEDTARDVWSVLISGSLWENAEGFSWYKLMAANASETE